LRRLVLLLLAFLASGCDFPMDSGADPTPPDPPSPSARDWPTYAQNPSRTGYNAGETTFDVENVGRIAPLWSATLGLGPLPSSSTPTVASGRVFVGTSATSGPNFFAVDLATGRIVWSADLGHLFPGPGSVGLGATAAVAGAMVVAGGGDSAYHALDAATGRRLWRHALDAGPSGFAWASPLVLGTRVYVGVSSEFDNPAVGGEVRALELASGAMVARCVFVPPTQHGADVWNSVAATEDGQTLFVATGEDYGRYDGPYNRALVSLEPGTLRILQADKQGESGQDQDFGTTPAVFGDRQGRTLVGASNKNGVFYAYRADAIASGPLWSRAVGINPGMMAAYDPGRGPGGTLLVTGDEGVLYGVDPSDGQDRWPPLALGTSHGNLAVANGLVFANVAGRVAVLESATGRVLRVLDPGVGGGAFSGVVVAQGKVIWMAGPTLQAWGLR
jgi:outer membrane protein assembly factor BamB